MIDPANNQLRPPIRRSWLRLRLGKAYYAGKRYLLWCSPKFRWAKERRTEKLPCLPAEQLLFKYITSLFAFSCRRGFRATAGATLS